MTETVSSIRFYRIVPDNVLSVMNSARICFLVEQLITSKVIGFPADVDMVEKPGGLAVLNYSLPFRSIDADITNLIKDIFHGRYS